MVTKRRLGIGAAFAAVVFLAPVPSLHVFGKQERRKESERVRIFFSPEAPQSERTLARLRKLQGDQLELRIDHHLLVSDFRNLSLTPSVGFQAAVKALRDGGGPEFGLSIFDEEGLRLAASYGLSKLPAVVFDHGGRVHIAYGSDPDLEELLKCRK